MNSYDFLIPEMHAALNEAGVNCGEIRFMEKNNNLAFSDGEKVFVKASLLKDSVQLDTEVAFLNVYEDMISSSKLLMENVLPLSNGSHAAFFRFDNITPVSYSSALKDPTVMHDMAASLSEYHSLEIIAPHSRLSLDSLRSKINMRVNHFFTSSYLSELDEWVTRYMDVLDRFVDSELGRYVDLECRNAVSLCHGDAHFGNFAIRDGRMTLLDNEGIIIAPREFDLTGLGLHLKYYENDPVMYDRMLTLFGNEVKVDVDLLGAFMFFKMLSSSGFLLIDAASNVDLFVERVQALEESFLAGRVLRYPL